MGRMLVSVVLLAWACFTAHPAEPGFDVQVTDAWIRWLPANLPGAGYMTLTNSGAVAQTLIGATSPEYVRIEFHQTHSSDGMSGMTPVESIGVKPHGTVRFAEGGYHLMLMQPTRQLNPGDKILITLRFAGGRSLAVPFAVRGGESGSRSLSE